jgi:hypothetical protein
VLSCKEVEEDVAGEEGWRGGSESFNLDEDESTTVSAIVWLRAKDEGGEMERGGESGEGREE